MKKYILTEPYGKFNHAGSKAKNDVAQILKDKYEPLLLKSTFLSWIHDRDDMQAIQRQGEGSRIIRKIIFIITTIVAQIYIRKTFRKVEKNSTLFIQFPPIVRGNTKTSTNEFIKCIEKKQLNVELIIHDLDGIRFKDKISEECNLHFMSVAKKIICQTQPMKEYLVSHGISEDKISVLNLFDYLHTSKNIKSHKKSDGITFAGNICKSMFLQDFSKLNIKQQVNMYGYYNQDLPFPKNFIYNGCLASEEMPEKLIGGWGLVWDGEKADTCTGNMGEYLKVNAPHKCSLYVVCRMPIIIWSKAALAPYITQNKLGIAIDSLSQIDEAIDKITDEDYNEMLTSIEKIAQRLEKGENLLSLV